MEALERLDRGTYGACVECGAQSVWNGSTRYLMRLTAWYVNAKPRHGEPHSVETLRSVRGLVRSIDPSVLERSFL
jgi:hypothetical protein